MLLRRLQPLCGDCRSDLFHLFVGGFNGTPHRATRRALHLLTLRRTQFRGFKKLSVLRNDPQSEKNDVSSAIDDTQVEAFDVNLNESTDLEPEEAARQARATFGASLPPDYLSAEEYKIYERLYGAPLQGTISEEEEVQGEEEEGALEQTLYREDDSGQLEEVDRELSAEEEELLEDELGYREQADGENDEEYSTRMTLMRDMAAAEERMDEEDVLPEQNLEMTEAEREHEAAISRTHPYTAAGRFATYPASIELPKDTFISPISGILSGASKKQLSEVATRTFGGAQLPDSVATPASSGEHLQQKPNPLEAYQARMGLMESNAFLAANMPGAYASVTAALVETRRRLGSQWLEGLLSKEDGPRILDAGSAGAGVLAWHEVLKAEWSRMHPEAQEDKPPPLGKATVITGSNELRHRVRQLLENTTFLPRMPDFVPIRDLPGSSTHDPALRKQYDIIIAPHTLWTLKEDYMRKAQVQNYFTLLKPNGGVLIIIEKGVPRGFELVAGAREVLLDHHISSPGTETLETEIQDSNSKRLANKETAMIVAPCTNHGTCPMYTVPGEMKARKDHCHFSQRFVRPLFLQKILGVRHSNHEDINFSYLVVQRGVDQRQSKPILQNEEATLAALEGFENSDAEPEMLNLPRVLAPPLKRHKHVVLDLCTPSAKLERWTLPKSFSKQGYRDARKAQWGDLWALGAKTRVIRTSRSGTLKQPLRKRTKPAYERDEEPVDPLRDLAMAQNVDKTAKREKTRNRRRLLKEAEDDL